MPVIDLIPLDSVGITAHRPGHERKWTQLTNVSFRDGSIVPRPGFVEAFGFARTVVADAAVEPSPANGLVEIWNPGSTATGRGAGAFSSEILRPNATNDLVAGWAPTGAATNHEATDEDVPDGQYMSSTTIGSQTEISFSNPSATYTDILGVRFLVRARVGSAAIGDAGAVLTVYLINTTIELAQLELRRYNEDETSYYYDFSILAEKAGSATWTDTLLDGCKLIFELTSASEETSYYLGPSALLSSTNWVNAVDGSAADIEDITLAGETTPPVSQTDGVLRPYLAASAAANDGLTSSTLDAVLQWEHDDIDGSVTFTDIDAVEIIVRARTEPYVPVAYELYYNDGSDDTLIDSGVLNASCNPYETPILVSMPTNPVSGVAWTQDEVDEASWKFKLKEAKTVTIVSSVIDVTGTVTGGDVAIDTIAAEVIAPSTTGVKNKIVMSNKSFLKVDLVDNQLDDVTNSVASDDMPAIYPFDHAILYGQVYVVNGVEPTKRYPNAGSVFESLTTNNTDGATALTGRTVCAFANRILYGWVRDNTTYTPERVAYSKIFDGGTHNATTSGDFDVTDSPGGVVALRTLNEDLAFCGKEQGIYALRRTGNAIAPIIVDPIDYDTQVLSQFSALRVLLQGKPVILFYGFSPTAGHNIFAFNGESVQPVGNAISMFLRDYANPKMGMVSFGAINPRDNSYLLFFAPTTTIDRTVAFSMNLNTLAWTRWDLPWGAYSAAIWNIASSVGLEEGIGTLKSEAYPGVPTLVLGGRHNLPMQAHDLPYDSITASVGSVSQPGYTLGSDTMVPDRALFTSTIETGDIQIIDSQLGEVQMMSFRLHLDYVNYGPVRLSVGTSIDGGLTYNDGEDDSIIFIGDSSKDGTVGHAFLDMDTPVNDRKIRFRIRVLPENAKWDLPYFWQIDRIFIEYQTGGVNGS